MMFNPYTLNNSQYPMSYNPQVMNTNNYFSQPEQVVKVHGKEGINALNIAPNSTKLCLDETEPIVWFVQTDGAGFKSPTAYDIVPHISNETKIQNNLEQRLEKLEGIIYGKSDNKSNATEQSNTNNTENDKSSKKFNG